MMSSFVIKNITNRNPLLLPDDDLNPYHVTIKSFPQVNKKKSVRSVGIM